jgi:hypothetical protein
MTTDRLMVPGLQPGPYTPPPIAEPRLYALLAVEVEPGKIVYYHLELDPIPGACTIEAEQDTYEVRSWEYLNPVAYVPRGPMRIHATLSGTVVSDRPDYRPPARTHATVDQRALPEPPP